MGQNYSSYFCNQPNDLTSSFVNIPTNSNNRPKRTRTRKAVYRCQMKIPDDMIFDPATSDARIREYFSQKLSSAEIQALVDLKLYWQQTDGNIVQFVADETLDQRFKHYFTYHPDGWIEKELSFTHYEEIKLTIPATVICDVECTFAPISTTSETLIINSNGPIAREQKNNESNATNPT